MDGTPEQPIDQQIPFGKGRMTYGSQVGVLAGLFGAGLVLSQIVVSVLLMTQLDLKNLDLSNLIDFNNPALLNSLKWGQFLAAVISFLLPAFIFTLIIREKFIPYLKVNKGPGVKNMLLIPILVVSSLPLIAFSAELNKLVPLPDFLVKMEENAETLTRAFLKSEGVFDLVINLIVVAVAAAVTEEVFFRGCLQRVFLGLVKNPHWAIWITAFMFSLLHFQFQGFIPRMLLGGVMGYLYFWTGSLWAPIFAHFVNNGLGVFVNYLVQKGAIPSDVETYGNSAADWVGVVTGTVVMVLVLFLIRKNSAPQATLTDFK